MNIKKPKVNSQFGVIVNDGAAGMEKNILKIQTCHFYFTLKYLK